MTLAKFSHWLMEGHRPQAEGPHAQAEHHKTHPWYKVMCLTGLDYFSTLGYQPGIAALAAGYLSPFATIILVLVTLLGALPIYRYIARESPNGEGSIAILERLLLWWKGKLLVLVLLGFVATDFSITITLSTADATAHLIENPFLHRYLEGYSIPVTLLLIAMMGGIFLKGFKEAVGVAIWLVGTYLILNVIVIGKGLLVVMADGAEVHNWWAAMMNSRGGNPALVAGAALILFPKLALGLSGFETGVLVMPLIEGKKGSGKRETESQRRGFATPAGCWARQPPS